MSQTPPPPPPGDAQGQPGGYQYPPQDQQGSYPSYPSPDQQGYYPSPGQQGSSYPQSSPYQYQQPPTRGSGLAIAALVLGIIALLSCWTIIGGILFGLLAVVLGFVASRRAKRGEAGGRGMAITGIVLGLVGAVISVVILVAIGAIWNSESAENLRDCIEQAGSDEAAQAECQEQFTDDVVGDQGAR